MVITCVLASASYWLSLQSELNLFGTSTKNDPNTNDYYIENFRVQSHNIQENKFAMMRGEKAAHVPANNVWKIEKPMIEEFQPHEIITKAQGQTGLYQIDQDIMTLQDRVQIDSTKQGTRTLIDSEEIVIDTPKSQIRSNEKVSVKRPGQRFEANGFVLNNDTGILKTLGPVKLIVEPTR